MGEQENREILSPEWQKAIAQGIQGALDNYELLGQVNVAPASFVEANDERGFPELSLQEQWFVVQTLFRALGVDPDRKDNAVVKYKIHAPAGASWTGVADVGVFTTLRSDENMFLHVVKFPDGKVDFVVAPRDFRL